MEKYEDCGSILEIGGGGERVIVTGGNDLEEDEDFRWCSTVARNEFFRISVSMYSRCTGMYLLMSEINVRVRYATRVDELTRR